MTADRDNAADDWDRAAATMQELFRPHVEALQRWAEMMAAEARKAFGVSGDRRP